MANHRNRKGHNGGTAVADRPEARTASEAGQRPGGLRVPWWTFILVMVVIVGGLSAALVITLQPSEADRIVQQKAEQNKPLDLKKASFTAGHYDQPVPGATDGGAVLASFYLYLAQGETAKAFQFVEDPNDPSVRAIASWYQRYIASNPELQELFLEKGVDISGSSFRKQSSNGVWSSVPTELRRDVEYNMGLFNTAIIAMVDNNLSVAAVPLLGRNLFSTNIPDEGRPIMIQRANGWKLVRFVD